MIQPIKLLDVVALIDDLPEQKLVHGHVGTVVEAFGRTEFLVEFSDMRGETYALSELRAEQLILLRHQPTEAV